MSLDPAALQALLDGERAEVRGRVREALRRPELALPEDELARGDHRARVLDQIRLLASEGHTTLGLPAEYGGGGNVGDSIAAFETLAHGDLSLLVKVGVQFGLFGGAVLHLGTERHHRAYLADIGSVALPGCFAMTERGHGSNVQELRTTATYDPETDEIVVHTPDDDAGKDWIGNAAEHGRMAAVFAQLAVGGEGRGVHAVLVPLRDEDGTVLDGVRIEDCGDKLGLDGVDNGRIWFDEVRVPSDNLLDRYGDITRDGTYESPIENPNKRFFTMLGTLIQGRVSIGGASISVAKSALTIAIRHGLQRRQFGPPDAEEARLLDYRTHQRRLLPALATTYALHFAQQELIDDLHAAFSGEHKADEDHRKLETAAAGLKAIASWHAVHTAQTCREACGGAGYLSANRFAALKADTDVFTTFEGDNTVLLQLVAKNLLTDYKDHFGELDPFGTAAFVAEHFINAVLERSAAREIAGRIADELRPLREDDDELLGREYHLELFRWREEHVLDGLAGRMRKGIDGGADVFEVFLDCQDHLLVAARAHVHRLVLEAADRAAARCEDETARAVLDRLFALYALWEIETDRGWFQEHGRISSARSKAVLKAVNRLCGELRPDAGTLVDAFAIPEEMLAAGIGRVGTGSRA